MNVLLGLLAIASSLVVPVVVIGALVWAVGRAAREDGAAADPGIGTVRRVFLYGLAGISLALAGSGVALLIGGVLDAVFGDPLITASGSEIAVALSLTVVGLPAWGIFFLLAQRAMREHDVERRSLARWVYLLLVRVVTLAVAVASGISVGQFVIGVESFDGDALGWLIVSLGTWGLHQRLARAATTSRVTGLLDRLYLAFASVLGLYVLAAGLLTMLIEPGMHAYEALVRAQLVEQPPAHEALRRGLVVAAIGGGAWWWHWGMRLRSQVSGLWQIVVFLFGILAGVATAITASGVALYTIFAWALDVAAASDRAIHFAALVPSAAFTLVGVGSWLYHRAVLAEQESALLRSSDPARLYRYLLAAAGLLTLGAAVSSALALAFDALVPIQELVRPGDWWRDQLAVTLTLAIVGLPTWWLPWSAAQRAADASPEAERSSLPRRAFLFVIFGVAVLVTLGNLAVLLFEVFDAALGDGITRELLRDMRWPAALLLTAGAIAGYYWLILRDDQAVLQQHEGRAGEGADATEHPAPVATLLPLTVTLIAPSRFATRLGGVLASRVTSLQVRERADAPGSERDPADLGPLAEVIEGQLRALPPGEAVALVTSDGAVEVFAVSAARLLEP